MKDRIRKVMETQNMTQQEFAEFLHISPASLSSIFTGRTRPTISIVEAIKKCIPQISTDWLVFGVGDMMAHPGMREGTCEYESDGEECKEAGTASPAESVVAGPVLNFSPSSTVVVGDSAGADRQNTIIPMLPEGYEVVKKTDMCRRTITEIRVFYSDQTWETFVPKDNKH